MPKIKDYYEVLGVDRKSTQEEVKKAYRRLAKEWHPDVNPDPKAKEIFREINEAYYVLSDETRRQEYDNILSSGDEKKYKDFLEYINEFVESILHGVRRQPKPRKGGDIRLKLEISLEEGAFGCEKELEYERWIDCPTCSGRGFYGELQKEQCQACNGTGRRVSGIFSFPRPCSVCKGRGYIIKNPCPTCGGRGRIAKHSAVKISVPPGTDDGDVLKVLGFGHYGERGGESGDLYVRIMLKPHQVFKKVGKDLHLEKLISFPLAVLGGTLKVPTLEGKEVEIFIQPGTESGSTKTLPGLGYPTGNTRGNLVVNLRIQVPKDINSKTRDLLLKLAKELGEEGVSYGPSLSEKIRSILRF